MDNYKQVRIAIFNSEPLAKLAEQQLYDSGVPCLLKSLNGGPGLWGSAYNLPHGLYVYERDTSKALDILELDSMDDGYSERDSGKSVLGVLILLIIVLALVIIGPMFFKTFI
jgi:hypothetical protein